jgi:hypothetical protein
MGGQTQRERETTIEFGSGWWMGEASAAPDLVCEAHCPGPAVTPGGIAQKIEGRIPTLR